jgi:hypothetical protein
MMSRFKRPLITELPSLALPRSRARRTPAQRGLRRERIPPWTPFPTPTSTASSTPSSILLFPSPTILQPLFNAAEPGAPRPNAVFDESGNFLVYPTLTGIKVVNLVTNQVSRILGEGSRVFRVSGLFYEDPDPG